LRHGSASGYIHCDDIARCKSNMRSKYIAPPSGESVTSKPTYNQRDCTRGRSLHPHLICFVLTSPRPQLRARLQLEPNKSHRISRSPLKCGVLGTVTIAPVLYAEMCPAFPVPLIGLCTNKQPPHSNPRRTTGAQPSSFGPSFGSAHKPPSSPTISSKRDRPCARALDTRHGR
jgi:hypothetical protein